MKLSEYLQSGSHIVSADVISPYASQVDFEFYLMCKFPAVTLYDFCTTPENMLGVTSLTIKFNRYKYDTLLNSTIKTIQSGESRRTNGERTTTQSGETLATVSGTNSDTTTYGRTDTTNSTNSDTTTYGRTDTTNSTNTTATGDINYINKVYGYDSAEGAPADERTETHGDITDTTSGTSTAGGQDTRSSEVSSTNTSGGQDTRSGEVSSTNETTTSNNGTDSYTENLSVENNSPDFILRMRAAAQINLIEIIAQDILHDIALGVYDYD